jgi:hypothetical protein
MTLKELMPVMPIVAMGIFASAIGFVSIFLERRAARKEHPENENHTSGAASH